jgi:D-glycero-alpha-D-manno-heptose 1-phosphate guanylyltransferase
MQAVILAGGLGTRLRAVVSAVPKPLAAVAGRPFLAWQLDMLARQGVGRVLLATGYLSDRIEATIGRSWRGMIIDYSRESEPLGTGGALRQALALLDEPNVLVLNGDTYLGVDLATMQQAHLQGGACVTIAACLVEDAARFGTLEVRSGHVLRFNAAGAPGPGLINAGIYILDRGLLLDAPAGPFSLERDFLEPQIDQLQPVAFEVSGPFIDIGTPEDFARAQRLLPAIAS